MIYSPREDSFLLAEQVRKYCKNKSVLDMGAGSGIQALTALKNGASSVLAADINPECESILKEKQIPFIQSDLFSSVRGKFDLIVFNPPYLPKDEKEDQESALALAGGKKGDETILRFLKDAPPFLNENSIILLVISSITPLNRIKNLLKKNKMNFKVLSSQGLFMEKIEVWKIFKQPF